MDENNLKHADDRKTEDKDTNDLIDEKGGENEDSQQLHQVNNMSECADKDKLEEKEENKESQPQHHLPQQQHDNNVGCKDKDKLDEKEEPNTTSSDSGTGPSIEKTTGPSEAESIDTVDSPNVRPDKESTNLDNEGEEKNTPKEQQQEDQARSGNKDEIEKKEHANRESADPEEPTSEAAGSATSKNSEPSSQPIDASDSVDDFHKEKPVIDGGDEEKSTEDKQPEQREQGDDNKSGYNIKSETETIEAKSSKHQEETDSGTNSASDLPVDESIIEHAMDSEVEGVSTDPQPEHDKEKTTVPGDEDTTRTTETPVRPTSTDQHGPSVDTSNATYPPAEETNASAGDDIKYTDTFDTPLPVKVSRPHLRKHKEGHVEKKVKKLWRFKTINKARRAKRKAKIGKNNGTVQEPPQEDNSIVESEPGDENVEVDTSDIETPVDPLSEVDSVDAPEAMQEVSTRGSTAYEQGATSEVAVSQIEPVTDAVQVITSDTHVAVVLLSQLDSVDGPESMQKANGRFQALHTHVDPESSSKTSTPPSPSSPEVTKVAPTLTETSNAGFHVLESQADDNTVSPPEVTVRPPLSDLAAEVVPTGVSPSIVSEVDSAKPTNVAKEPVQNMAIPTTVEETDKKPIPSQHSVPERNVPATAVGKQQEKSDDKKQKQVNLNVPEPNFTTTFKASAKERYLNDLRRIHEVVRARLREYKSDFYAVKPVTNVHRRDENKFLKSIRDMLKRDIENANKGEKDYRGSDLLVVLLNCRLSLRREFLRLFNTDDQRMTAGLVEKIDTFFGYLFSQLGMDFYLLTSPCCTLASKPAAKIEYLKLLDRVRLVVTRRLEEFRGRNSTVKFLPNVHVNDEISMLTTLVGYIDRDIKNTTNGCLDWRCMDLVTTLLNFKRELKSEYLDRLPANNTETASHLLANIDTIYDYLFRRLNLNYQIVTSLLATFAEAVAVSTPAISESAPVDQTPVEDHVDLEVVNIPNIPESDNVDTLTTPETLMPQEPGNVEKPETVLVEQTTEVLEELKQSEHMSSSDSVHLPETDGVLGVKEPPVLLEITQVVSVSFPGSTENDTGALSTQSDFSTQTEVLETAKCSSVSTQTCMEKADICVQTETDPTEEEQVRDNEKDEIIETIPEETLEHDEKDFSRGSQNPPVQVVRDEANVDSAKSDTEAEGEKTANLETRSPLTTEYKTVRPEESPILNSSFADKHNDEEESDFDSSIHSDWPSMTSSRRRQESVGSSVNTGCSFDGHHNPHTQPSKYTQFLKELGSELQRHMDKLEAHKKTDPDFKVKIKIISQLRQNVRTRYLNNRSRIVEEPILPVHMTLEQFVTNKRSSSFENLKKELLNKFHTREEKAIEHINRLFIVLKRRFGLSMALEKESDDMLKGNAQNAFQKDEYHKQEEGRTSSTPNKKLHDDVQTEVQKLHPNVGTSDDGHSPIQDL